MLSQPMIFGRKSRLAGLAVLSLWAGGALPVAAAPAQSAGIVVEEVRRGSTGDQAGLAPGDVLLSWRRMPAPSANPTPARGSFHSPFDLMGVWIEQVPRGEVTLVGRRGEREMTWRLRRGAPSYWWLAEGIPSVWEEREVRTSPALAADLATGYRLGRQRAEVGDPVAADDAWKTAAAAAERRGDELAATWLTACRAGLASQAGNWEEADRLYAELIPAWERRQSPVAAHLLRRWGNDLLKRQAYRRSRDCFRRALAVDRKAAPKSLAAAWSLTGLGYEATQSQGWGQGDAFHRRALKLRRELAPGSSDLAVSWYGLAFDARDQPSTWRRLERALSILEAVAPGTVYVAEERAILGLNQLLQGHSATAADHFRSALAIAETQAPEDVNTAFILQVLGAAEGELGHLPEALGHLRRALAVAPIRALGDLRQADLLHNLGTIERRAGQPQEGAEHLCQAVDAVERYGGKVERDREQRTGLSVRFAGFFRDCTAALLAVQQSRQALELAERGRAKAFLQLVSEQGLRSAAGAELRDRLELLNREYDRIQAVLGKPANAGKSERLKARLHEIYREKEELLAAQGKAPAEALRPLDLPGIRGALDPRTALLTYSVSRDQVLLFVVRSAEAPGEGLTAIQLPVDPASLQKRIQAFRDLVQSRHSPSDEIKKLGAALYEELVAPAEAALDGSDRLLISPDGPLRALPFAALVRRGRYLIEWKPLATVISATVFAELKARRRPRDPATRRLVVFADPDYSSPLSPAKAPAEPLLRARLRRGLVALPGTRREAKEIAALFPASRTYTGTAATEEAAKAVGPGVDILHFAAHGVLDEASPLDSCIVLSLPHGTPGRRDNGLLQTWEIIEAMRLDAELVTLSACNSALGPEVGGDGLIGTAWAFQYAGARTVLGTLWSIDDDANAGLMAAFYTALRDGKDKAEALRIAQLHQMAATTRSHPYFWAALELLGDWQ